MDSRRAEVRAAWVAYSAALLLLVLALVAARQFWQVGQSMARQVVIRDSDIAERDRLLQLVNEETGVRAYVATGEKQFLDTYYAAAAPLRRDRYIIAAGMRHDLTLDAANGVQRYFANELALMEAGRRSAALADLRQGKTIFDRMRAADAEAQRIANDAVLQQRVESRRLIHSGIIGALWIVVMVLILAFLFTAMARRARLYRSSALQDPLTGAGNRRRARQALHTALKTAGADGFAVIFIDLDGFKKINDVHGHAAGDAILKGVATRLKAELRSPDVVCRLGGDEFVCIVAPPTDAAGAAAVAERLARSLRKPYVFEDDQFAVGCSIGVSLYPQDGRDAEMLLERADRAMYGAKAAGGGVRAAQALIERQWEMAPRL